MAITGLEIRDANPDDADIIATYNSNLAFETEGEGLAPGIVGPGVAAMLADASKGRSWVAEAEIGWQLDDRWSLLAFVGAGRAATELSDLDAAPSRVAKGGGFRYLIASRYGFEMGMDIARGPEAGSYTHLRAHET